MLIRRMAMLVVMASLLASLTVSGRCANAGGVTPIVRENARFEVSDPEPGSNGVFSLGQVCRCAERIGHQADWPAVKFTCVNKTAGSLYPQTK